MRCEAEVQHRAVEDHLAAGGIRVRDEELVRWGHEGAHTLACAGDWALHGGHRQGAGADLSDLLV